MNERVGTRQLCLVPRWDGPAGPMPSGPAASTGRPGVALALALLALATILAAVLLLAPPSRWEPQAVFATLLALVYASHCAHTRVRDHSSLDAGFLPALAGAALLGPLPAILLVSLPDLTRRLLGRLSWTDTVNSITACAWACLAATLALSALGGGWNQDPELVTHVLAPVASSLAFVVVNCFLIATMGTFVCDGLPASAAIREASRVARFMLMLIPVLIVTPLLVDAVGLAGLVPLVMAIVLAQRFGSRLLMIRPIAARDHPSLVADYAQALAEQMHLDREQRLVLRDAALQQHAGCPSLSNIERFEPVMRTVLFARERWDGQGELAGLAGCAIPIESRILAVAQAWADLTARGTRELDPRQAFKALRVRAGSELDPAVVAAAGAITRTEIVLPELGPSLAREPSLALR